MMKCVLVFVLIASLTLSVLVSLELRSVLIFKRQL